MATWVAKRLISSVAGSTKRTWTQIGPSSPLHHLQKRFYSPEPIRRFYAEVNVVPIQPITDSFGGTWGINLDKRALRTPSKRLLEFDNESVAHVVANEWAVQKEVVMLNTMHMTALTNTSIDNPFNKTKFDICNAILSFLPLDTILYRAEENERLWELQRELWDPVLQWFQTSFDVKLPIVAGAITPPTIPEDTLAVIRRELTSNSFNAILGLQFATEALKSLVLTMGAAKLHINTGQALRLSRLELDFQTQHWGTVEWSHDLEFYDTMSRFACGMMFFSLHTYPPFRYTGGVGSHTGGSQDNEKTQHRGSGKH